VKESVTNGRLFLRGRAFFMRAVRANRTAQLVKSDVAAGRALVGEGGAIA
jgi:hypothetical protein